MSNPTDDPSGTGGDESSQLSLGPKLALDELLAQLIERARDVMATQGRLRGLLRANQAVVGNLSLPVLLREIVLAACELARARYGALGVIDPGHGLEQFVHVGIDDETVARIGHLPTGKGLLGAVINEPRPIRLRHMADDSRSVGFPVGHPPMAGFLGVPIRVRDEVYGNLYLTEREEGEFTAEDEQLVSALAATAGVAIANARLYEDARSRQDWLQASAEVSQQLLSDQGDDPLQLIARRARETAGADLVALVRPAAGTGRLIVEIASSAKIPTGLHFPAEDVLIDLALRIEGPALFGDITVPAGLERDRLEREDQRYEFGPTMVLPLSREDPGRGALVIARGRGGRRFAESDLAMADTFTKHVAVALELAGARADQQRVVLLEDRDRIARDLHDHVIQRLFAIGLTVQSVAVGLTDEAKAERLNRVVTNIDETIQQTRTTIFQLSGPLGPETGTVRLRLLDVAAEVTPALRFHPVLRFNGPVDAILAEPVVDDLVAVLREALTNTARHAGAGHVDVDLTTSTTRLTMTVTDDGVGIGASPRRSGLANLRHRAEEHGGTLVLGLATSEDTLIARKGTSLTWSIPLV